METRRGRSSIVTDFLFLDSKVTPSKEQTSFNFMAAVTLCSDFGAPVRSRNGWLKPGSGERTLHCALDRGRGREWGPTRNPPKE